MYKFSSFICGICILLIISSAVSAESTHYSANEIEALITACNLQSDGCGFEKIDEDQDLWKKIPCNPATILTEFPSLQMNTKMNLSGYYTTYELDFGLYNVDSIVVAIPQKANIPEEIGIDKNSGNVILPEGVNPEFMAAITGNFSPRSYLDAALVYQILRDYGWSPFGFSQKVLDDFRWKEGMTSGSLYTNQSRIGAEWTWLQQEPESFSPVVHVNDGEIIVQIYTYNDIGTFSINRFDYRFVPGSYVPTSYERVEVATGGEGTLL